MNNTFDISDFSYKTIEEIPPGTQVVICARCPLLTSICPLPRTVIRLLCMRCPRLVSIPENYVEFLSCSGCDNLDEIRFSPNLINLNCENCPNLLQIPPLPKNLESLRISGNGLHMVPIIPPTLRYLGCTQDQYISRIFRLLHRMKNSTECKKDFEFGSSQMDNPGFKEAANYLTIPPLNPEEKTMIVRINLQEYRNQFDQLYLDCKNSRMKEFKRGTDSSLYPDLQNIISKDYLEMNFKRSKSLKKSKKQLRKSK